MIVQKKIRTADDLTSAQDSVVVGTLNERYTKLNEKWAEAEADLKQFPIPQPVMYTVSDDGEGYWTYLGFAKVKGAWRICWGTEYHSDPAGVQWTPITESTLDIRLCAVKHFTALRGMVREAAIKTVTDVDSAISDLDIALL